MTTNNYAETSNAETAAIELGHAAILAAMLCGDLRTTLEHLREAQLQVTIALAWQNQSAGERLEHVAGSQNYRRN